MSDIMGGADVQRERWALRQDVGSVGERALLLTLAVHAHDDTLATWLGSPLLCRELASSRSSVTRYTNALAGRGLIVTAPLLRRGGRGQTATLFILNVDGWLDGSGTVGEAVARCNCRAAVRSDIDGLVELPPRHFRVGENCSGLRLPPPSR